MRVWVKSRGISPYLDCISLYLPYPAVSRTGIVKNLRQGRDQSRRRVSIARGRETVAHPGRHTCQLPSSLRFRRLVSAGIFICYLVGRAGRPAGSIGERPRAFNSPLRLALSASKIRLAATQARCGRPPRRDAEGPRAHTTSGPCMLSPAYAGGSRPAP